jgi:hypothetical protein
MPSEFERPVELILVPTFVAVTVTPGTTLPDESRTDPVKVAKVD